MSTSVDDYFANLPDDRRRTLTAIRDVINANLPPGYVEVVQFGMPAWCIPLERYPETYNKQPLMLAALGAQKQHLALYLLTAYGNPEIETWFRAAWKASGKKLDMGKSCVRFKTLDAVPLDVIGETIAKVSVDEYIATYEATQRARAAPKAPAKPAAKSTAKAAAKPKRKG